MNNDEVIKKLGCCALRTLDELLCVTFTFNKRLLSNSIVKKDNFPKFFYLI